MNTNDYVNHKDHCYCTYRRQYYNLTERKCRDYEYDRYKDYYDLNRRWHIVSAILSIVPEAEEIPGMEQLRNFRINFLEKDSRFERLLGVYDVVGPFIARELALDENRREICMELAGNQLAEIAEMIVDGKNHEALVKYAEMVNQLAGRYSSRLARYAALKLIPDNSLRLAV